MQQIFEPVTLDVYKDEQKCYEIVMEDSFAKLPEVLKAFQIEKRRICIVTDSNVAKIYGTEVQQLLADTAVYVSMFVIPAGEAHKTLAEVQNLYEHLIVEKFDRKDMLLALGGGVIGDMTGYAAATYLRGIDFVQVPTTLLAQVDSSIGGKTGVDFNQYKNMVGAFYQPRLVYMNLSVLKSLPREQFASGMGEVIKHGLIRSADYYRWLREHKEEISEHRELFFLQKMVLESCRIKRDVVQRDPHEQGERALLNFGHTIGHAIEKLKEFRQLHGECVSLGIVAATWLSVKRGYLSEHDLGDVEQVLCDYGLPVRTDDLSCEEIVAATKLDKKMRAGQIRFILLNQLGNACMDDTLEDQDLLEAVAYVTGDVAHMEAEEYDGK